MRWTKLWTRKDDTGIKRTGQNLDFELGRGEVEDGRGGYHGARRLWRCEGCGRAMAMALATQLRAAPQRKNWLVCRFGVTGPHPMHGEILGSISPNPLLFKSFPHFLLVPCVLALHVRPYIS